MRPAGHRADSGRVPVGERVMERLHGYALPLRANSDQVADANGDGEAEVGGKGMNNAWDGL